MSPLGIEILLHYYCRTNDFRDGNFKAPEVARMLALFEERGLIVQTPSGKPVYAGNHSALLPYVEALRAVPLPVQIWAVPKEETA